MRQVVLLFVFSAVIANAHGQPKLVKLNVDSSKIYLRYFYKLKKGSDYHLNDSAYLLARKITLDTFYLDKFVNHKKEWTKVYRIELAKDSLNITERFWDKTGKFKFKHLKEPYYSSFLIQDK